MRTAVVCDGAPGWEWILLTFPASFIVSWLSDPMDRHLPQNNLRTFGWSLLPSLVFMVTAPADAHAQTYPAKPVRLVIPFPPSGAIDWTARLVATKVSEQYESQFVIDNRPGAGGTIAADIVARAAPDAVSYTHLTLPTSDLV